MTVTADLNVIEQTLSRIELIANEILQKMVITGDQIVVVGGLSDISEDLGLIKAGEFRSGKGVPNKAATPFTGVRVGSPGWLYGTTRYAIAGVKDDVLQFGLSVIDGSLYAAGSGSIAGWSITATEIKKTGIILDSANDAIYVGAAVPRIEIQGGTNTIKTSNYSAGTIGWSINGTGDAEFANVRVRGEIRATVFSYNELTATAGSQGVFKSAGKLQADCQTRTSPTTFTIDIEDPASGHTQLFAVNDILRIQSGTTINWVTINSVSDQTTFYRYTATKDSGGNTTFRAGTVVVDYGPSGQGFLFMSADDANGPFYSVRTHAGAPWTTTTEQARLGNMRNAFGTGANSRYGFGVGDYAGGNYLSYNAETADAFILKAGSGVTVLDSDGLAIDVSSSSYDSPRAIKFKDGSTTLSYIYAMKQVTSATWEFNLSGGSLDTDITHTAYGTGAYSQITLNSVLQGNTDATLRLLNSSTLGQRLYVTIDGIYSTGDFQYDGVLRSAKNSTTYTGYIFVPLTTPLTSTSFDGDAFSTTAKTLIDLSSVFSAPAGIKAVLLRVAIRDSGSAAGTAVLWLGPTNTAGNGMDLRCSGVANDAFVSGSMIVPCDANGDIYYQIVATGASTFDLFLEIWGYAI